MKLAYAPVTGEQVRVAALSRNISRLVQRCGTGSECNCPPEQRRAGIQREIGAVTAGGGAPLPEAHRVPAERALAHDFSAVRIHAGPGADRVASGLHAHALTFGTDVLFRSSDFRLGTADGDRLLHHELAHVAQQAQNPAGSWIDSGRSDPLEVAADRAAEHVLALKDSDAASHVHERAGTSVPIADHQPRIQRFLEFPEVGFPELGPELGPEVGFPEIGPEVGAPELGPDLGVPEPAPVPELGPEPTPEPAPEASPEPVPPIIPAPTEEEPEEDEDQQCGSRKLPLTRVTWTVGPQGQGGSVKASPLTRCPGNTVGSIAQRSVYQAQFDCIVNTGKTQAERAALGRRWVAAHLLHGATPRLGTRWRNLHGPGDQRWNIIIADSLVNRRMNSFAEGPVLSLVYDQGRALWYEVQVAQYWPHSPFVARAITMSYGLYDTNTGSEGPTLLSQSVWSPTSPPACPATPPQAAPGPAPSAPAAAPLAAPKAPPAPVGPAPDFTSTVSICYQVLTSRTFPVRDGGLTVRLRADWVPKSILSECPQIREYTVTLRQKGLIFDSTISETKFPVGKATTMNWRRLENDDYYLEISVPDHDPTCCLQGGISVTTFSAPRPSRRRLPEIA
jgi:hypothetical protein